MLDTYRLAWHRYTKFPRGNWGHPGYFEYLTKGRSFMSVVLRSAPSGCCSLRRMVPVLAVMMGMLLLAVPMFSQTATGRISGTVKDQTGGAIVGAAVRG